MFCFVRPEEGRGFKCSPEWFFFYWNQPHWANLVIELPCPSVCVCVCLSVCAIRCSFVEASHWPWCHMISSRPFIGPSSLPPQPAPIFSNLAQQFFLRVQFFFVEGGGTPHPPQKNLKKYKTPPKNFFFWNEKQFKEKKM